MAKTQTLQSPSQKTVPQTGRLTLKIVLPIIVAIVFVAATVTGLVFWAAGELDSRSADRERGIVSRIISEQIARLPRDQEMVVNWDDAVLNTRNSFYYGWVDLNLGRRMASRFNIDRVFLFDSTDSPIYAMDKGAGTDPMAFPEDLRAIAPILARLRSQIAVGGIADFQKGGSSNIPSVVDIARIGDVPAIISAMPILSDTGRIIQAPGSQVIQVVIILLNSARAEELSTRHLLDQATFRVGGTTGNGHAYYPIKASDGRFVAFLEWQPDRPGSLMLGRTAPVLSMGFVVAALLILLLLERLWQSSATLRTDRARARHQATHDLLTGLPNRLHFESSLAEALGGSRAGGYQVALLMLDLDRFKQINDTLGHSAGDDLIRAVGQRLQEVIGNHDLLTRLGGDEFAVIHMGRGGEREAMLLGRRLIEAIEKPFDLLGGEAFVGVSVGVALASGAVDPAELIRMADIALHEAKTAGRGRAVLFEQAMSELVQGRHTIESELREALRRDDQISVAFQPVFARETGRICGAEALARWSHPRLGQVSPALFIPVAESSGLIEALGDFVLTRSCELGARWPGETIAVNISPTQLRNPAFPARVFHLLEQTGMQAEDLELEITEGILLEETQEISDALAAFRSAGIRIALDDFGTGYSSLNYLKRYPVDRIKVDRSFVSQLAPGSVTVAIVQAMLTLAHALKIEVTAEGVETHEQMGILSNMGCNCFQGFLLSAPVPPGMIESMFRGHRRTAKPAEPVAEVA